MAVRLTVGPELRLLNLHFFNICRHHPTLKFKPHATDDERYVSGIDGVPLIIFPINLTSDLSPLPDLGHRS